MHASVANGKAWPLLTILLLTLATNINGQTTAPLQASILATVGAYLDPNGTVLSNWTTALPCSSWTGVTCDSSYNVVNISLTFRGLIGTIPSELGSISTLISLDLSSNWLTGTLPESLGSLTSLRILKIGGNLLEGSIPSSFGSLTSLTELNLSDNQLTGSIPSSLKNLTGLQILYVGSNYLSGSLADDAFTGMAALSKLGVQNNEFNGTLPSSLGSLYNLTSLNMSGNYFDGTLLPSLSNLPLLVSLNLSTNLLSGEIPASFFSSSSQLTHLDLSSNTFQGTLPAINSTVLTELYLYDNFLTGYLTNIFSAPPESLTMIHLATNAFKGPVPATIFNLTNLQMLKLSGNALSGNLPSNLTGATLLTILDLSDNLLSGPFPEAFLALPSMVQLIMESNSLEGVLTYFDFSTQAGCVKIDFANNLFTGGLPEAFPVNLLTVDFSGNLLSGAINGSKFDGLSKLTSVQLGENQFTGGIPYQLWNSTTLQLVTLNNNSLTEVPTANVSSLVWDGTGFVLAGGNPICDDPTVFPGSSFPSSVCGVPSSLELEWTPSETTPDFPVSCTDTVCPGRQFISIPTYFNSGGQTCSCSLPLNVTILLNDCPFAIYNETFDVLSLKLRTAIAPLIPVTPALTVHQVWVIGSTQTSSSGAQLIILQFYSNSTADHVQLSRSLASKIVTYFQNNPSGLGTNWGPVTFVSSALTEFSDGVSATSTSSSESGISWWTILLVAFFSALILVSCAIIIWFFCIREKDRYKSRFDREIEQYFVRHIPLSEVKEMTQNFSEDNILGEGGFGIVYRGTTAGNQLLAVKRAKESSKADALQEFQKEVRAISQMSHNNVVKLMSYCDDDGEQILVYEFCQHGTLKQQLHPKDGRNALSFQKRLEIAIGAAEGLRYMHIFANPPVIHRDIKSDNILIDEKWQAKISDFGLLKDLPMEGGEMDDRSIKIAGTLGYLDPEYFVTGRVTPKSDVFSFGVVLLELITGRMPVFVSPDSEENERIPLSSWATPYITLKRHDDIVDPTLKGEYPVEAMQTLQKIACDCVQRLSTNRPDMSEVANRLGTILGAAVVKAREEAVSNSGRNESQTFLENGIDLSGQWPYRSYETSNSSHVQAFSIIDKGR